MPASGLTIVRADHAGSEFDTRAALCRAAVDERADIEFLVHIYLRQLNLAVDRLSGRENGDELRRSYRRIVRAITDEMRALDRALRHFRTGSLIRLALQGPRGAVFANSVLLDEYVMATVSVSTEPGRYATELSRTGSVGQVDEAVSRLVDRIRALVGQPSLNPGGWFQNPPDSEHPAGVPADNLHLEIMDPEAGRDLEMFRDAVADGSLQYVALFRGMEQLLEADSFEGQAVKQFLTRIAPQARRELYRQFGREAEAQAAELARLSNAATGSPLLRAVYDVEQGAIFYYRVGDDRHLIGVTLDQSAVGRADARSGQLALKCQ